MSDALASSATPAELPRPRRVAVIGPPNSGKSTLFNQLTGLRQKVANFPGVTVEHRSGVASLPGGREALLIDLPGIYGFSSSSEDQRVAVDVLHGRRPELPRPDAVLLILDATNLERHLLVAAPVLGLGLPTLVVLNMADDLRRRGGRVDLDALARRLDAPVVLVSATRGEGLDAVRRYLAGTSTPRPTLVELPVLNDIPRCREWASHVGGEAGYRAPAPPLWTRRLDAVLLHPLVGPLVFAAVVLAVFQAIFTAAVPLMDGVQALIDRSGSWLALQLPDSPLRSLLIEGVWGGVGSVVVFLPQILILFLFIGILEDSGYLSRAALIADRTMARVGLQGKSFIPLLSAYACAVPAIMATRTIENRRDRMATILIAPFMTCSARLPVYTLLIAAFIPERPVLGPLLGSRAATLLGLYALGFAAAIVTARLLKSTILRSGKSAFVLEMPPYRWPTLRSLALRLYDRSRVFLRRAGTVILAVAVLLWLLAHLPLEHGRTPPIERSIAGTIGRTVEPLIAPLGFNWKIGIGLITSLAAREVIVGTLGTIYGIESNAASGDLQAALQQDLSLAGAVALLVFFAFAMQCTSTLAIVRRETASWKWPAIQFAYMTALAYVSACATYHLLR
ncbi:MAG TPA: ferrous iron transporter B [Candidatus Polarisedimenticolaceae bacterium]|nr:ferrous iron transporter B [Candidatus Polarisedimenticolaceae bacterium]